MSETRQPGAWLDYFSTVAAQYARYRPQYPAALYAELARRCRGHQQVWDCATGNGQAAVALAEHFQQVWASDASAEQIAQAQAHERVHYLCAQAQHSGLAAHSVDLVTVAQALHWFPLDEFYAEVQRVLRPGGCLAVWSYATLSTDDEAVNAWIDEFYDGTLGDYWSPQRRWVEQGYRELAFPFAEEALPEFAMHSEWSLAALAGYFSTWSATEKYRRAVMAAGEPDPFPLRMAELAEVWPAGRERLQVRWPLHMRLGRVAG